MGPRRKGTLYLYVSIRVIFRDILHRVTVQRERLNPLAPRKGVKARPVKGGQNKPRPALFEFKAPPADQSPLRREALIGLSPY